MFGTKKGAVAKAMLLGPKQPSSAELKVKGMSGDHRQGGPGKPASASGKKAK